MSGRIERIWRKRFHRGPMDELQTADLRSGGGLVDSADQGGWRQLTLISLERWAQVCDTLGVSIDPALRRANLLVSGIDLRDRRGQVLRVGACRVRLRGETRPCERMDEARVGLRAVLKPDWGGGAFGEILTGGQIRVGDVVEWEPQDATESSA